MSHVPRKNKEYLAFTRNIHEQIALNLTIWKVDQTLANDFFSKDDAAQAADLINSNSEFSCRHTAKIAQYTMADLKSFMGPFTNALLGNLNIPDEEIEALGLRPRHPGKHEPIPQPREDVMVGLVTGHHHDVDAYFSTLQHGQPTKHITDHRKHHGFILRYKVDGDTEWRFLISIRKHRTLVFNDADEGKYLHAQAAWLNPRLEAGPWSEEVIVLIN